MKKIVALFFLAGLLAGCSSTASWMAAGVDLSAYRHVWVEHQLADGDGVDENIARQLRGLGYDATAGPKTLMPDSAEIILSYDAQWTFDFTRYLIRINMTIRTARTDKLLAKATNYRPSITSRTPDAMIATLLKGWFKPHVPPVPAAS